MKGKQINYKMLLQGITIKPLVKLLNVKRSEKKKCTMNERIHERVSNTIWGKSSLLSHPPKEKNRSRRFPVKIASPILWKLKPFVSRSQFMDHLMAGIEDIVGSRGNYHVRDKFKRFDNKFIRPYLLRNYQGAEPKILETYSKLTMKDAMEYMRRNASTVGNISGTESMSAIFKNYTNSNFNTRFVIVTFWKVVA